MRTRNLPKVHLLDPLKFRREQWTACGIWVAGLSSSHDYEAVDCGSCKRTNVYRLKRLGVTRLDWIEDETD